MREVEFDHWNGTSRAVQDGEAWCFPSLDIDAGYDW